jgi:hypothetical protein
MRIFGWKEDSDSVDGPIDIGINTWFNGKTSYKSTCPDGVDWLNFTSGFNTGYVMGATRKSVEEVWFAWTSASGGGFPNTHIQVAQINVANWPSASLNNQWQIWNPDYAFSHPHLTTNSNGEVGVALGWGGGSFFASSAVGILGDFIVWYSESSTSCRDRWGDYTMIRPAYSGENATDYASFIYSLVGTFNPRYVLFGRS